jgi:hypothetical protein
MNKKNMEAITKSLLANDGGKPAPATPAARHPIATASSKMASAEVAAHAEGTSNRRH